MKLEPAKINQVSEICDLVNLAYRGDSGWTKETDIVSGDRCVPDEIIKHLSDKNSYLMVAVVNEKIVSCICIEIKDSCAYIGLFSVDPEFQSQGVGKEILSQAESYALRNANIQKYVMVVVSQRIELIEYYERRGYRKTGSISEYPSSLNVGVPLKSNLTVEYLEKSA